MLTRQSQILLCVLLILACGCASVFDSSTKNKSGKKKEGWSFFRNLSIKSPNGW